ncbi:TadE/TadG family type IV pilus assembly protein [Rhizobium sp. CG5]|uniref:vWA domain-containing protein n=1 Tax=Rhizobium sp. CG5 TaxID=2726076 RepID=UPI00203409B3|nr:TadE/TadG family type IV pilus assembly protein [Rhizobium sp. CG5]
MRGTLRRLANDRRGNFGLMTALILPVGMATVGVAMDMTKLMQVRSELQAAADSAALAAASALAGQGITDDEAIELARNFLVSQMANLTNSESDTSDEDINEDLDENTLTTISETSNGSTGATYDVKVDADYNVAMNAFTSLLGYDTVTISVSSSSQSSTESKNALSMFLVLDRSGSMAEETTTSYTGTCTNKKGKTYSCTKYYTKMEALQLAVADLTAQLDTADPDQIYVRTAAVSYNASMQTPTSFEWGTATALAYVNALTATGGTDSSDAMEKAYTKVTASSEVTAHTNKSGQTDPGKYILFMTDGDNNYTSADTETKATCDKAKAAGVEVYTVAFMAPTRGQTLLAYCATDTSHYYDADDAEEVVAAFKEIGEKASLATTRLTQ